MSVRIIHGDMLAELPKLIAAGERFHACVTDPPYHLASIVKRFGKDGSAPAQFGKDGAFARASRGFMGKKWDGGDIAFRPETWRLVFDALLPGAHMLCFGGTRTCHRMACAIEDAGSENRRRRSFVCRGFGRMTRMKTPRTNQIALGIAMPAQAKLVQRKPAWLNPEPLPPCIVCAVAPRTQGRKTCRACRAYMDGVVRRGLGIDNP